MLVRELVDKVNGGVEKFADNTKLFNLVRTKEDCEELKMNLINLDDWTNTKKANYILQRREKVIEWKEQFKLLHNLFNIHWWT